MAATTITQTVAGSYNWVCPDGVFSAQVECWGGGGNGGDQTGTAASGGGGGGEYAKEATLPVVPGTTYPYTVGTAGAQASTANAGGSSTFNTTGVVAHGGGGVAANATGGGSGGSGSTNTTHFNGGGGATGSTNAGGGGGSGGTASAGNAATTATGATAVTGGGPGGAGATISANGSAPTSGPGGGGGGAKRTSGARTGGAGFAGQVVITYTTPSFNALRDDFSTQNTNRWTWSAGASASGGQLVESINTSYTGTITTAVPFDLTGASVPVQLAQLGGTNCTFEADLEFGPTLSGASPAIPNMVLFGIVSTDVGVTKNVVVDWWNGSSAQTQVASVPYNATNHKWFRVRHDGASTVYFETSPNGKDTWTTIYSGAWPTGQPITGLYFCITSGIDAAGTPSPATTIWDNVGLAPPVGRLVSEQQAVNRASLW